MTKKVYAFFINKDSFFSVKGVGGEAVTLLLNLTALNIFVETMESKGVLKLK